MPEACSQIHLQVERWRHSQPHTAGGERRLFVIEQPTALSVVEATVVGSDVLDPAADLWLEPLPMPGSGKQSAILAVRVPPAAASSLRVNGLAIRHVHVLSVGDVIEPAQGDCLFHVNLLHRAYVGPAKREHASAACPICLGPVLEFQPIYVCPCGAVLHDADESAEGGGLDCAKGASLCPACASPIRREPYWQASDEW